MIAVSVDAPPSFTVVPAAYWGGEIIPEILWVSPLGLGELLLLEEEPEENMLHPARRRMPEINVPIASERFALQRNFIMVFG